MQQGFYRCIGKRILDLGIAIPGIIILAPIIALLAILVRLKLGKPVIFNQTRPGYKGNPFTIYKFRTMLDVYDEQGELLAASNRLTPFGRLLRSSSLDELPELLNILKGEMSVVGPRPLRMHYLPLYSPEQARRHDVKPGMTGWAQVNGRNSITWKKRFELDVWYVDHLSFWLDLKIIFLTVVAVIRREGISAEGCATIYPFTGSTRDGDDI